MDKQKPPRIFIFPGFKTLHGLEFNSRLWLTNLAVSWHILPGRFSGCRLLHSGTWSFHWCINEGLNGHGGNTWERGHRNQPVCHLHAVYNGKKKRRITEHIWWWETRCLSQQEVAKLCKIMNQFKEYERAKSGAWEVAEIAKAIKGLNSSCRVQSSDTCGLPRCCPRWYFFSFLCL